MSIRSILIITLNTRIVDFSVIKWKYYPKQNGMKIGYLEIAYKE